MGNPELLPEGNETDVFELFRKNKEEILARVPELRPKISFEDAYRLTILAVRMAVLAVRTQNRELLRAGLIGLVIDDSEVDWRDFLGALSIIEDCARRLGLDFYAEVLFLLGFTSRSRKETIQNGYFSRALAFRSPDVFGFAAVGPDFNLKYVSRSELERQSRQQN
jgi:hypothetical protein